MMSEICVVTPRTRASSAPASTTRTGDPPRSTTTPPRALTVAVRDLGHHRRGVSGTLRSNAQQAFPRRRTLLDPGRFRDCTLSRSPTSWSRRNPRRRRRRVTAPGHCRCAGDAQRIVGHSARLAGRNRGSRRSESTTRPTPLGCSFRTEACHVLVGAAAAPWAARPVQRHPPKTTSSGGSCGTMADHFGGGAGHSAERSRAARAEPKVSPRAG